MTTEAGDQKLLGNLRQLIDQIASEPKYRPANPKLTKEALELLYTAGQAAAGAVSTANGPYKVAVTDRQAAFDALRPRITGSFNYVKASGAPPGEIDDAKGAMLKLTGKRRTAIVKDDPKTPVDESKQSRSASQMSYDNQLGNLASYLAILSNISSYNPNEDDIKLTTLNALLGALQEKNDAVSSTLVALSQARGVRDQVLYLADDSIVNTAKQVKAYIVAAFGTSSQLYKQTKGLKFVRAAK